MRENQQSGFPTRLGTSRLVQPQEKTRNLNFWNQQEEGLCVAKADQLCSYCTADLQLCICICRLLVL